MADSGIKPSQECADILKTESIMAKTWKYLTFVITADKTQIVLEKTGMRAETDEKTYEEFLKELPTDECRYAVYDWKVEKDGGIRNLLIFYTWTPDNANARNKMMYASSSASIQRAADAKLQIQGTDEDEVAYDTVLAKALRNLR